MVELDINGVKFSHGSKEILKGISLKVGNGKVVGIIGQNGSGKTTLLNCINTEYKPTSGCVKIIDFSQDSLDSGHEVGNEADVRDLYEGERSRILATVEQNSQQSFPFTVIETVRMGRYSRSSMFDADDDEEELELICKVMEDTGVIEFAHRSVNELSGGEWRRVMIAQALAQEPEILLLDEPTLHLDINHQFELMDLCRNIVKDRNILIIIVTHDLPLAARYCDKVMVMEHGEVVASGKTSDVITEELIERVFFMRSKIAYDEDIGGTNVTLIDRIKR